jgi:NodT family efflux transporter outer membrane factor (OMF) lipoprotein
MSDTGLRRLAGARMTPRTAMTPMRGMAPITARLIAGACLIPALLLASGCVVGPNFKRPDEPTVAGYLPPEPPGPAALPGPPGSPGQPAAGAEGGGAEAAQRIALGQKIPALWWDLFHSPRLDETLTQAITASYSLAAAKATLAAAQELIVEARAGFYPQVALGASGRRGNTALGGGASNLFSLGPSVSYSLDAFGGTRRRVEQQTAVAENQRYQLAAAYLTLTGGTVTEAIAIASTRLQIATAEDLIRNDQKNLDLTQREFDAGKVAKTDVLTAAAQLEADRTQLPPLRQQLSVAQHALAVLVGKPTGETAPPDFTIEELTLPPEVPVSLPSELVRQRPDILAAEAQLHADSAAVGVAISAMYPSITLSGSLVQEALSLANLFRSSSRVWSAGGDVNQPLYTGGSLSAQRRAAIDTYNAQLAIYQQTVLQAFGQVADSLSALQHDAELLAVSHRALDIASDSLKLQRSSYAAGKTSALQLISAENTYSEARLSYARAVGQRLTDTAQLFIAVGGGWWNAGDLAASSPPPPAPAPPPAAPAPPPAP